MKSASRITGVLSPVVTPFKADLSPDTAKLISICKWLLSQDVGLAVFGTNSEANSLSVGEKIELMNALVEAGIPADRMMPGTGCSALTDTVELTRHAMKIGAGGVLMLPPFYYKGVSDDGLFASYSEVIQRVGDSRLKIYVYHIPPVSNVPITLTLIERLLKAVSRHDCRRQGQLGRLEQHQGHAGTLPATRLRRLRRQRKLPAGNAAGWWRRLHHGDGQCQSRTDCQTGARMAEQRRR